MVELKAIIKLEDIHLALAMNYLEGLKLIAKELRKILWIKYQIKDEDLFNRAYDYIKEYY